MAFKVLISDPLSEDGIQPLRKAGNVEVDVNTSLSSDELAEIIGEYDALLVRSQTKVTRDIISRATNLKIIGRAGVGVDNIDLSAATEYGVIVVNAPDGNTNSAAEHTVAMLMSLARKIPQAYLALKNGKWDRKTHVGVELKGKTLGVIGMGRIGAEVAARAKGQRMNVIAYDPFLTKERADKLGVDFGSVEDVVGAADFITVHTPLIKETKHLLNKDAFNKMKEGVRIINCARGGIIDEEALYDAIQSGKVAGAALDVFEEEPATDHRLLELPEVIATPHLGASTVEAQENVAIDVSHDVVRYLTEGVAKNPVNLPAVPKEVLNKIEPYFYLSEKLGSFLTYLTSGVIEEINISYSGELNELDVAPLTRNTIKGLLKRHLGDHVNDVNASYLAEKRGIQVNESKSSTPKGFTNLLKVEVKTKNVTRSVAGTLLSGLGPRLVQVDAYSVDAVPEGNLVVIKHNDRPGAIGKVGTLLAQREINIGAMQVGRSGVGGEAIMILSVDKNLEDADIEALQQIEEIEKLTAMEL
ncbi:phosphoglycerate dehydrogenase [Gracilibacillus caseinilyticus]|uniref:D-3-phosphoglycerate dehydrogenase n=1 Tax=Gracilibacillus caseinilyticus TaxID=2932256 RepID=A0ABY4F118_9BACI|nr:phosphoglycerate dehydrogenase [Gracilibacillus caseinilyticus]UOQ49589.1 phosphoglycerate dehydrogenase [Gracilibacillus caseinilyticus]